MAAIAALVALSLTSGAAAAATTRPSDRGRLVLRTTFGGPISPKSVASSGHGLVFAQNMMYRHTITVYDARRLRLVKTISDAVQLSHLGVGGFSGIDRGAPVEAAFTPDGRDAFISNYSMYGTGFGPEGTDVCTPSSGYDDSFVYRVDLRHLRIDAAIRVGPVPKVVAVTPDGKYVLVANWCGYDLSVISTRRRRQVLSVPIGPYPRGIAITPKGGAAYIAVMGSDHLVRLDLHHWTTSTVPIGAGPRALVFSPDGRYLYATLNAVGRLARIDRRTGHELTVATGSAPRSLAIAADGRSLYVVNYESGTVSKVRTRDMSVLQTIPACYHPIGITYDRPTGRVWVACYTGSIRVYDDR
jgi:YVTN family beta-propeller protein